MRGDTNFYRAARGVSTFVPRPARTKFSRNCRFDRPNPIARFPGRGYEAPVTRPADSLRLLGALMLALAAAGCLPKIGDPCSSSLDCSQRGERLCDNTQPQGYCTIYNCEPDECPDNAACVAFNHVLDPA